ncbi:hypothetical protein PYW08_001493 [Mythimna loreyi]|uniref:Uncharacterized protein n=1 Tax=Mythimna loreyi TaxID=667449 RepID=A0ACC2R545_9NEOP|nr:hypothetical protein PYW08_001493 [Mythimna loreyi]
MLEKLKSFYNKDNLDYSTGYVDPFEFHQTFYQILVAFKVADLRKKNPPSYFNHNMILFLTALLATILSAISVYHGLETADLQLITEAGTYTLIMGYKLLVLSCTRRNLPQYHNFLRALKKDFQYICSVGEKYRTQYFENQLKTWKICVFICTFNGTIGISMNIFAYISLFYYLATHDADTEQSRPLLFPFWLSNVDISKSPVYEVLFMFANVSALLYTYNYTFLLQTQIVWIRQITSKVDVVIWNLQDLLVDIYPTTNKVQSEYFSKLIKNRMRDIIIHHQSMYSLLEDFAIVYKKLLMYEQAICGPVICLTAYCVAEKLDSGEFQAILLILCLTTIVVHFIPNLMCTYLTIKVHSVCEACWSIPFWNAGPVIRPYMVFMMQRSLRPLPLQATGFRDISVETFSNKMTSAYSLFNMLRAKS